MARGKAILFIFKLQFSPLLELFGVKCMFYNAVQISQIVSVEILIS